MATCLKKVGQGIPSFFKQQSANAWELKRLAAGLLGDKFCPVEKGLDCT